MAARHQQHADLACRRLRWLGRRRHYREHEKGENESRK
jgi:hypothetical protein